MSEIVTGLRIDGRGNVASFVSRAERGIDRFSKSGQRSMRALAGASRVAAMGLDRLGNRYTALAGGAAGAGTARYLIGLEAQIRRLGVQAGSTAEEMDALKQSVYAAAQNRKIRVDPGEIIAGIEKIVEKTGDLGLARDNIENIGYAIQATGAAGQDIGAMIADLSEKFQIRGADEMLKTLDGVVNQGKAGAFTLNNLATQGERVTAAYGQFNRVGPQAVREMGAMLQMIKKGVGGPEQAATALEALIRTFNDAEKRKLLSGAGIKLVAPDNPKQMRSIIEIVKDLIRATGGDAVKLSTVFDGEAMRAFNAAVIEFNQTGGFASFDKFMNVMANGNQIIKDSETNAQGANAALGSLLTAWNKFADSKLTGPIQSLAESLDGLSTDKVDMLTKSLGYGAAALGAFVVASKIAGGVNSIRTAFRGRGSAVAGAAGGAGSPMPVMVVNWPGGGGDTAGGRGRNARIAGSAGRTRGLLGLAGRGGKLLGRAVGPLGALMYGADFVGAAMNGDTKGMAGAGGGAAGAVAGAAAGAVIGSIVPVIGTAIGGLLGSLLGSLGGEYLARAAIGDPAKDRKDTVDISLKIDSDARTQVKGLASSRPEVGVEVDTGYAMAGGG